MKPITQAMDAQVIAFLKEKEQCGLIAQLRSFGVAPGHVTFQRTIRFYADQTTADQILKPALERLLPVEGWSITQWKSPTHPLFERSLTIQYEVQHD